ncbi:aldo/keto reductase [Paenibacillus sp. IB182496]|uniref:Aldo/keto reductase n=1 Tax=Paenibacillus sabuli TaxID=2772509 RepID=A0A927GQ26_9BACL|nr:aldo/keto reductase [Paenibacillus sabuli]MBD2843841.1 aldo/keto reductase [Paenibacillus sabuli]
MLYWDGTAYARTPTSARPRKRGGILSGKYGSSGDAPAPERSRAQTDPNFRRFLSDERLALGRSVSALAEASGCSPSALALAWLMRRPAVSTVIVGATRPEQVEENYRSLSMKLKSEIMPELDRLSDRFRHGEPFATYRLS